MKMGNFREFIGFKGKEAMGLLSELSTTVSVREDGLVLFVTILAGRLYCQQNISNMLRVSLHSA